MVGRQPASIEAHRTGSRSRSGVPDSSIPSSMASLSAESRTAVASAEITRCRTRASLNKQPRQIRVPFELGWGGGAGRRAERLIPEASVPGQEAV